MKKNPRDGLTVTKPLENLAMSDRPPIQRTGIKSLASFCVINTLLLTLTSCNNILTDRYDATAKVTYTWQVSYSNKREKFPRQENFATSSLLNVNGQKPDGAVTGPDDKGLWWPALPPRPTVDEIEEKQQPNDNPGSPELLKQVKYELTYQVGEDTVSKPTNHQVYREVTKAHPSRLPLKFTLGVGDASVEKASRK